MYNHPAKKTVSRIVKVSAHNKTYRWYKNNVVIPRGRIDGLIDFL